MRRRGAAVLLLVLPTGILLAGPLGGCGRYGPPERTPPASEEVEPEEQDEEPA